MHCLLYVLVPPSLASTSEEARDAAYDGLMQGDFVGEGSRFSSPIADWFVIGGRWSGELVKMQLDKKLFEAFVNEYNGLDNIIPKKAKSDWKKKEAKKIFKSFFPEYKGTFPWFEERDSYNSYGHDDDAMIVTDRLWNETIADALDISDYYAGGKAIFLESEDQYNWDSGEIKKEDVVNHYWCVVIDFHI